MHFSIIFLASCLTIANTTPVGSSAPVSACDYTTLRSPCSTHFLDGITITGLCARSPYIPAPPSAAVNITPGNHYACQPTPFISPWTFNPCIGDVAKCGCDWDDVAFLKQSLCIYGVGDGDGGKGLCRYQTYLPAGKQSGTEETYYYCRSARAM